MKRYGVPSSGRQGLALPIYIPHLEERHLNPECDESISDSGSGSPAPSLYSFSSSIDGRMMLRNVYGRVLNNQNDTYFLPADNEEHRRLDLQHQIITLSIGGLYPAAGLVRRALNPRADRTPTIMDVGTGSGSWAIDMAKEFPHCDVVGVDLAPPQIDVALPANCRFEIDDANLGFAHYKNSFDVVHARSISAGIRDFPTFLDELAKTLRPGGVLLLGDGEMQLYDENERPMAFSKQGSREISWTHRVFFAAYNAMKNRGGSIDSPSMSPTWLRAMESLTDVGWHKVFIPIGPWRYSESAFSPLPTLSDSVIVRTDDQRERIIAEMLRSDCLSYIAGMEPLLLSEGYFPESVENMIREASAELRELRVHLHSRWSFAWAVKS